MVFDRLRAQASQSALFSTAWGYGIALVLVSVIPGAIVSQDLILGSVSGFVAAPLGVFVAGVVSRTVTRTRTGDRLATTAAQAGLAFVLAFPLTAAVVTLLRHAGGIPTGNGFPGWLGVLRYFNDQWWVHYAALGLTYFVAMMLCTAVWQYLPQPRPVAFQPWPVARMTQRRPREITTGLILIAVFFIVGMGNAIMLLEVARIEIPPLDTQWRTDAARARAVSEILGIRIMPIGFVGLLLLTPLRWRWS